MAKQYRFYEMFNLTGSRVIAEPSDKIGPSGYNQELFVAIFWEESAFRNISQNSGWDTGRAVGFGQVQWAFANTLLGTKVPFNDQRDLILKSDPLSVDLAIKAMLSADRQAKGLREAALRIYATGSPKGKLFKWDETSDALLKIPVLRTNNQITQDDATNNKDAIIAALDIVTPGSRKPINWDALF